MENTHSNPQGPGTSEDPWDVFDLDDELVEPEPEYGDFWGELDDDCSNGS